MSFRENFKTHMVVQTSGMVTFCKPSLETGKKLRLTLVFLPPENDNMVISILLVALKILV